MAEQQDRRIALLPIKPCFVESILAGRKKVEFRRPAFRPSIDYVVIYASSPVQKVVGYFRVRTIARHDVAAIWTKYAAVGGINHRDFNSYYSGAREGVAIEVDELFILDQPMALSELDLPRTPPQHFSYVAKSAWTKLEAAPKRPNLS